MGSEQQNTDQLISLKNFLINEIKSNKYEIAAGDRLREEYFLIDNYPEPKHLQEILKYRKIGNPNLEAESLARFIENGYHGNSLKILKCTENLEQFKITPDIKAELDLKITPELVDSLSLGPQDFSKTYEKVLLDKYLDTNSKLVKEYTLNSAEIVKTYFENFKTLDSLELDPDYSAGMSIYDLTRIVNSKIAGEVKKDLQTIKDRTLIPNNEKELNEFSNEVLKHLGANPDELKALRIEEKAHLIYGPYLDESNNWGGMTDKELNDVDSLFFKVDKFKDTLDDAGLEFSDENILYYSFYPNHFQATCNPCAPELKNLSNDQLNCLDPDGVSVEEIMILKNPDYLINSEPINHVKKEFKFSGLIAPKGTSTHRRTF